jgi:hypothetical protein
MYLAIAETPRLIYLKSKLALVPKVQLYIYYWEMFQKSTMILEHSIDMFHPKELALFLILNYLHSQYFSNY